MKNQAGVTLKRILQLQLLFIAFTLTGLIIIGFFPALLAIMAVTRQYKKETADAPIHTMYWRYYKENFLKGNLYFLPFFALSSGLVYFIRHLKETGADPILYYGSWIVAIILLIFWIYGLPSFVHLHMTFAHFIRGTFLITLIRPFHTVLIAAMVIAVVWIGINWSPILAIFLIAPLAYYWLLIALHAFFGFVSTPEE